MSQGEPHALTTSTSTSTSINDGNSSSNVTTYNPTPDRARNHAWTPSQESSRTLQSMLNHGSGDFDAYLKYHDGSSSSTSSPAAHGSGGAEGSNATASVTANRKIGMPPHDRTSPYNTDMSSTNTTIETPMTEPDDVGSSRSSRSSTRKPRESAAARYRRLKAIREGTAGTGLEDEVVFNEWEDTIERVGEIEIEVIERPPTPEDPKARRKREKREAEEFKARLKEGAGSGSASKKGLFGIGKKSKVSRSSSELGLTMGSGSQAGSEVDLRQIESRGTAGTADSSSYTRNTRETSFGGGSTIATSMSSGNGGTGSKWSVFQANASKISIRKGPFRGHDSPSTPSTPERSGDRPPPDTYRFPPAQSSGILRSPRPGFGSQDAGHASVGPSPRTDRRTDVETLNEASAASPHKASKRLSLALDSPHPRTLSDRRPSLDMLERPPPLPTNIIARPGDSDETIIARQRSHWQMQGGLAQQTQPSPPIGDRRPSVASATSEMSDARLFFANAPLSPMASMGMSEAMARSSSTALPQTPILESAAAGAATEELSTTKQPAPARGLGYGAIEQLPFTHSPKSSLSRRPSLPASPASASASSPRRTKSIARGVRDEKRSSGGGGQNQREMFFSLDSSGSSHGFPLNMALILPRELTIPPRITSHYPSAADRAAELRETVFPPFPAHLGTISTLVLSGIVWKRMYVPVSGVDGSSSRSLSSKLGLGLGSHSRNTSATDEGVGGSSKWAPAWQKVFMAMSLYTTFLPTPENSPDVSSFPLPPVEGEPSHSTSHSLSSRSSSRDQASLAETLVHLHIFPLELQDQPRDKSRSRGNAQTTYMPKEQRFELERRAVRANSLVGWGKIEGPEDTVRGDVLRVAWTGEGEGEADWFCVMDDESEVMAWVSKIRKYAQLDRSEQEAIRAHQGPRRGSATSGQTDDDQHEHQQYQHQHGQLAVPALNRSVGGSGSRLEPLPQDASGAPTPTPNDFHFSAPTADAVDGIQYSHGLEPASSASASLCPTDNRHSAATFASSSTDAYRPPSSIHTSELASEMSHSSYRTFGHRESVATTTSLASVASHESRGTQSSSSDGRSSSVSRRTPRKMASASGRDGKSLPPLSPPPQAPLPPLPPTPAEAFKSAANARIHTQAQTQTQIERGPGPSTLDLSYDDPYPMGGTTPTASTMPKPSVPPGPGPGPGQLGRRPSTPHASSHSTPTPHASDTRTMPVPIEANMSMLSLTSTNTAETGNTADTGDSGSTRGWRRKMRMKAAAVGLQDEIRALDEADLERLAELEALEMPKQNEKPKGRTVRFGP